MLFDDLRHAFRRALCRPILAAGVIALLASAAGVTTAMVVVVDAFLVRPLPFDHADRLIRLDDALLDGPAPPIARWRLSPLFDAVERADPADAEVLTRRGPERLRVARVTPGLFDMLGVHPLSGRVFVAEEGRAGADDRILVSEALWRSAFSASPSVRGSRVTVDDRVMLVVGVMPADFRFPEWNTDAWVPISDDSPQRSAGWPSTYARVAAGVPMPAPGDRLENQLGGRIALVGRVFSGLDQFGRRALWGLLLALFILGSCDAHHRTPAGSRWQRDQRQMTCRSRPVAILSAPGGSRRRSCSFLRDVE
jgi:hypothetical protein